MARGHLTKRSEGSWSIVIELDADPTTGKRRQQWATVKGTKRDAEAKLTELLSQRDKGTLVTDPTKMTTGQFLAHWLDGYVAQSCRPKTQVGYRELIDGLVVPFIGGVPLVKLTGAHLREMYGTLLTTGRPGGRPLSARTVQLTHTVLKKALSCGVQWGMLVRNVADGVSAPKPQRKELAVWDAGEARRYLATVTATEEDGAECVTYGTALAFALETGCRRGEVVAVRWSDVSFEHGTVQISQSTQRIGTTGLQTGMPKTSHGRRRIKLTAGTVAALKAHRARQNALRLAFGAAWQANDLVFCTSLGTPIEPRNLYRAHMGACAKAGVPRIPFHGLRHTHATLLLLANVAPKVVSERLGHANIAITLDTYSHVLPAMQDAAADKLEDLLRAPLANR